MSIDVTVSCPHCGSILADENITYNVAPIYYEALGAVGIEGGLRGLDGAVLDHKLSTQLEEALDYLESHSEHLRSLEPSNGWGSTQCVRRVLRAILGCEGGSIIHVY